MASPGMVQTVRGPVAPAELGRTLAHEHVFTIANPARMLAW
jgi:predicted metal-dependent phosphotriesterase family hydrolase